MKNQERSFGVSVGTVTGLLAAWMLWHGRVVHAVILGGCAVPLVTLGLLRPSWLRWPSAVWWRLARALGWINERILLSVVFVAIVTPVGLVMRLTGWDPMRRRHRGRSGSGWIPSPERLRDPKHFERMY